jgi:hypothetical protein
MELVLLVIISLCIINLNECRDVREEDGSHQISCNSIS